MGILDVPGITRSQANAAFQRSPSSLSVAGIGDSLVNNGGSAMAVWVLASTAAAGDTSISVTAQAGVSAAVSADMTSDALAGYLVQVGSEWALLGTQAAFTGSGPFAVALAAPLVAAHVPGERVVVHPMVQSNNSPQPAFWAHLLSKGKFRFGGTYGRGGWTAKQVFTTYVPLIVQAKPTFAAVMAGRNRDAAEGALSAIQTGFSYTAAIWDALLAAGITPIAHTLPPLDGATAQQLQDDEWFNASVRVGAARRGIPLVDTHALFVDPTTGGWLAAYQGDGTHPSNAGRQAHGQALWAAINAQPVRASVSFFPVKNTYANTAVYPSPVEQTNALKLTTGGTVTGSTTSVVPAKWLVSIADADGSTSVSAAPDGNGNALLVHRNAGTSAGGAASATTITPSHNSSSQKTTLVPGHTYRAMLKLKTTGLSASNGGTVQVRIVDKGASGTTTFGVFGPIALDVDGYFVWDFLCTSVQPTTAYVELQVKGTVSSLAYDVALWGDQIVDLTALGQTTDFPMLYQ